MPFAEINGTSIYYESHGRGDAVVFVHGGGGNHLSWWQQVPAFAHRYRCLVYDQRGFGTSPLGDVASGTQLLTEDLASLLDYLGIDRAILVAQSLGGWPCWGLTAEHPDRVRALIMGGTVGSIPIAQMDRWAEGIRTRGSEKNPLANAISPRLEQERPELYFLYWAIQRLNPMIAEANPILKPESLARRVDAELQGFAIPTLFLVGEEDQLMPPDLVRAATNFVPNARLEMVANTGHSIYFENALHFNQTVLGFLDQNIAN